MKFIFKFEPYGLDGKARLILFSVDDAERAAFMLRPGGWEEFYFSLEMGFSYTPEGDEPVLETPPKEKA